MLPMPYPHRTLKMKSKLLHRLYFILACMATSGIYAQDDDKPETVFVTGDIKNIKKEKMPLFGEAGRFISFTASVPLKANDNDYDSEETKDRPWLSPDGINLHAGYGVHSTETLAISAHTGIDGLISEKLVAIPVYGSLLLHPKISEKTSLVFQAGIGWSFALGRGDLSGLYQKYRVGYTTNNTGFFLEVNAYGFGIYDIHQVASLNVGITLFKFD